MVLHAGEGRVVKQKAKTVKGLLLSALVLGWSCIAPIPSSEAASEPPAAVADASTVEALNVPGSVKVTIERVENQQ